MLEISPAAFDALTRDDLFRRIRSVLLKFCSDRDVANRLASPSACDAFWTPPYQAMRGMCEHDIAVRLAYLLVATARGLNPDLATQADDSAVTAMKIQLEDTGVLPFAAFD